MLKNLAPVVILFGSAARGDNDENSDIDILIIDDSAFPNSIKNGKVEIQKFSKIEAIRKALEGDLFMLHILHEGIVISDSSNFFPELREKFIIKKLFERTL